MDIKKQYVSLAFKKPDSAFMLAEKAHELAGQIGLTIEKGWASNALAVISASRGNDISSLQYYQRALDEFKEINDLNGISNVYSNMGIIYDDQGDYPKALMYYFKAIEINEKRNKPEASALVYSNVAGIYFIQKEHELAFKNYRKAMKILQKQGDSSAMASIHTGMGLIYKSRGQYQDALIELKRSYESNESDGDLRGMANSALNLALVYIDLNQYDTAHSYFKRSGILYSTINNLIGLSNVHRQSGMLFLKQKEFMRAITECRISLNLAQNAGATGTAVSACQCLYRGFKGLNRMDSALLYLERTRTLDSLLQSDETGKKLQKFEFSQKLLKDSLSNAREQHSLELKHQQEIQRKNNTRNIALGSVVVVILLAGGLYTRLRYTRKTKKIIEEEKNKSDDLLHNILPHEVAAELKQKGFSEAKTFEDATVLFTDFKGFTRLASQMNPNDLVADLNHCFTKFDDITEQRGLEKIKTIGDAYMAVAGLPLPSPNHAKVAVLAALDMVSFIAELKTVKINNALPYFEVRVGLHSGGVIAGIVGKRKFAYDIWGDTVNIASRMESNGETGRVNISQQTYELIKNEPEFQFESRGKLHAKGKGELEMYFVSRKLDS